jgi:hypothetical protein
MNSTNLLEIDLQLAEAAWRKQTELLRSLSQTLGHYFRNWQSLFEPVTDWRQPNMITYPLASVLTTGVLMHLFRLTARRAINFKLRQNGPSQAKFAGWFAVATLPHGDTLNYVFRGLAVREVQQVVCRMVATLIRKKVLDRWRLFGHFLVAIDGTGVLSFRERHCPACLTRNLKNGTTVYYHPVLEAKLVTANGLALSLMTEFIENPRQPQQKQDCELKAFYRLITRLKAQFPRLPLCLLLDGLYAGGPTFQRCEAHAWRYLIVLTATDLPQVQASLAFLEAQGVSQVKQTPGGPTNSTQTFQWWTALTYRDSHATQHTFHVIRCQETSPAGQTSTWQWLTNYFPTQHNVAPLANQGGRLRWKIENEGFNVQKNGGYALEHPFSHDENASKVFYLLLQMAHLLFQLLQKGSLLRQAGPHDFGSAQDLAFKLLEAWRNVPLTAAGFRRLAQGRVQIRLVDT